ncbi:RDD family protein [Streptomyces sp. NPDC051569]|uniref:RDD family protein n=1 Tax=Streptomyces sp. NPDC051569 TaxID=3365661 RepID=UPI0037972510
MATPPGDGGNVPPEGFYPDPSIPGYVRYWNGAAWVPGTSRPAPQDGPRGGGTDPAPPAPPALSPPFAVDETGPVFFDEDPARDPAQDPARDPAMGGGQEPASAWQADVSRQTGFGGERDHRVSWGAAIPDPRVPGPAPMPGVRALGPGADDDDPLSEGTVAIRAMRRGIRPAPGTGAGATGSGTDDSAAGTTQPPAPRENTPQAVDSTMAIRALRAARREKDKDAGTADRTGQAENAPPHPNRAAGSGTPGASTGTAPAHAQPPAPLQQGAPVTPGAPATPWARSAQPVRPAHQAAPQPAQPAPPLAAGAADRAEPPVVPWKPPVEDPFLQAARAQAAARPAGLGRRFVARLIDTVVLGAIVGALAVPLFAKARTHIDDKIEAARQTGRTVTVWLLDGTTAGCLGAVIAALLVVGVLYEALPTAKWGRTLGKKLCGLDVRGIESHEPPAFGAALRRWLVYGVLGVLVVGVVNVLWCLFDRPWRQCWHDKVARTFVAR